MPTMPALPMTGHPLVLPLFVCLFVVGGLGACSPQNDSEAKPASTAKAALSVRTVMPAPADWAHSLAANGNIAAWQETIVSSEIGGLRLSEVRVNVGDSVKKGQVLALLAADTVEAELRQARANVNEAQAAFAEAQANADRARRFQETGAMSQQQITQYLTAEQTGKARIDVAKARLHVEELRLAQTRVVAPDDGIISGRVATVGAVVQVGQELFRLILRGRLEWRAEVTASEIGRMKPGARATVVLASGAKVPGQVRSVAPAIDPQTRTGLVYIDLAPSEAKAGMFARGEIALNDHNGKPLPRPNVLTLPQSAVLLRDGFAQVFRIGPDRKLTQLKVTTGRRVGDRVEILSGLDAQTAVVESGVGFLNDGDTVEVVGKASVTQPTSKR